MTTRINRDDDPMNVASVVLPVVAATRDSARTRHAR